MHETNTKLLNDLRSRIGSRFDPQWLAIHTIFFSQIHIDMTEMKDIPKKMHAEFPTESCIRNDKFVSPDSIMCPCLSFIRDNPLDLVL